MAHLDEAVTDFGGIALRYGGFYGAANDGWAELVRKRMLPIIGDGGGYISWIHVEDAAAATVLALEHEGPQDANIVDDNLRRFADACPSCQVLAPTAPASPGLARATGCRCDSEMVMATRSRSSTPKPSASWADACTIRLAYGLPAVYSVGSSVRGSDQARHVHRLFCRSGRNRDLGSLRRCWRPCQCP